MNVDIKKFEKFFEREISTVKDVMILPDADGSYELFGKYKIYPSKGGYYRVSVFSTDTEYEFTNIKNAVTWCTFDNVKKYYEAGRIKDLDLRLCSMEVDIAIHQKLANKTKDKNNRWIYLTKYEEDLLKKKAMLKELNSYINTSKLIQAQKFKSKGSSFSQMR
jgi:hypothetical protein